MLLHDFFDIKKPKIKEDSWHGGGDEPKDAWHSEADVVEGSLEANTPNPVVVIQDLNGKILDTVNLSVAVQKYKLGNPQDIKNQLAHQAFTTIGNYIIASPMAGQPQDKTTKGVAEAGFPGAPDVEMPPMKPSGDPERDKLKQEYTDLHREIKSLVDLQYTSKSAEEKIQAKARIKQLNNRADQIRAILEPRQPPNEWQKKTYGYDDNWNKVNQDVAEARAPKTEYDRNLLVSWIQNYIPHSDAGKQVQRYFNTPNTLPPQLAEVVGLIDEIFYESLENGSEGDALPDEKKDLRFFYQAVKQSTKQDVAEVSDTMHRYGRKILQRAKAAQAERDAESKKEEPQAPIGISTRDLLQQLRKPTKLPQGSDFATDRRKKRLASDDRMDEEGVAEGMFTKGPAIDPVIGKQINNIITRLWIRAKQTKDDYLRGAAQELFDILKNTGGTYSVPGSPGIRDVAEADKKRNPTRDFLRKHPVPDSEMVKPVKKQGNQDAKTSLSHMMGGSSNELMKNLKIKEQGVSEGANYWTKLQDTRSKKINSLVDELEKSIQ